MDNEISKSIIKRTPPRENGGSPTWSVDGPPELKEKFQEIFTGEVRLGQNNFLSLPGGSDEGHVITPRVKDPLPEIRLMLHQSRSPSTASFRVNSGIHFVLDRFQEAGITGILTVGHRGSRKTRTSKEFGSGYIGISPREPLDALSPTARLFYTSLKQIAEASPTLPEQTTEISCSR